MREITSREKLQKFMKAIGTRASREVRLYFTGGATAVILGWRSTTIDVDIRFDPELDELYRALPVLKEELGINIELASPADFIPPLPGWEGRCVYIGREGKVSFYHYDPYAQALAKIERGHSQDQLDVAEMFRQGLLQREKLVEFYEAIKPQLYRYPAIDPDSFSKAVEQVTKST